MTEQIFRVITHKDDIGVYFSFDESKIDESINDLAIYIQVKAENTIDDWATLDKHTILRFLSSFGAQKLKSKPNGEINTINIYWDEDGVCGDWHFGIWYQKNYNSLDKKYGDKALEFFKLEEAKRNNDLKLLELSAKAAGATKTDVILMQDGINYAFTANFGSGSKNWYPLHWDGDALRLAVTLGISIKFGTEFVIAQNRVNETEFRVNFDDFNDQKAATRHAIVLAAADIGRLMLDDKPKLMLDEYHALMMYEHHLTE